MVQIFYSPGYVCSGYSFDTTRKAKWIADSLAESPIAGIRLSEPKPLTREQVAQIHGVEYILAVATGQPRGLAESQGFSWDAGLWPMVLASNGGAVAAGLSALEGGVAGSLSSGLHHARRDSGAGFCTFNGLVIAAREALDAGARTVLILDLDAHCGGGTQSLIAEDPRIWQIDVSVNSYDSYRPGSDRVRLEIVEDSDQYLSTVQRCLDELSRGPRFDLCLYNAGMDPHEKCSTGGRQGITREVLAAREQLVFDWCRSRQLPVAFVLAGGYVGADLDKTELVGLHRLTLAAAASISNSRSP
jgi:acetoin utilization deacetylase AcuC-like enzyme